MAERMHRTQILFPEDDYRRLRRVAQEQRRSVGSLVREAVAKQYPAGSREDRLAAVREMAEMRLPVSDWPQMEQEIIQGYVHDECYE